jgi:predicted nucleic acid-binding protein
MGLIDDLGPGPVGVDTAPFIYFIEAVPPWLALVRPLFLAADALQMELVTSAITLLEVMVVPFRRNESALAARYEALLTRSRGIRLIDITRQQVRQAALLRATTGLRTPDELQLSAAQTAGCSVFLTNDRRLPPLPNLRIVQLADHLPA